MYGFSPMTALSLFGAPMAGGIPIDIDEPKAGAAGRGAIGMAAGLGAAFFAGLLAARLAVFFFAGFLAFLAALFTGFLTVFLTVLLPAFFLVVFLADRFTVFLAERLAVFFTDFLVAFFLDFLDFAGMGSPPIRMVGALTGGTLSGRIVHQPSCFLARGSLASRDGRTAARSPSLS